jgi:hypothetical protein
MKTKWGVARGTERAGTEDSRGKGEGEIQARRNQEGDRSTELQIIVMKTVE